MLLAHRRPYSLARTNSKADTILICPREERTTSQNNCLRDVDITYA